MRFSGTVGFTNQVELTPGVFEDTFTERPYYGEVLNFGRRLEPAGGAYPTLNDDITTSNSISIVADPFASANILKMRYVIWLGYKWKVTNVEVRRPRLILTLGGQWNGNSA